MNNIKKMAGALFLGVIRRHIAGAKVIFLCFLVLMSVLLAWPPEILAGEKIRINGSAYRQSYNDF